MKKIAVVCAGGLARETQWLIERINTCDLTWDLIGFFDDTKEIGDVINGKNVIGSLKDLRAYSDIINVVVCVANPASRKKIVSLLSGNEKLIFPNLIDPEVLCSDYVQMGIGNIVFAKTILSINIALKDFNVISFDCSVGHDAKFDSFVTLYPSVNVSGNVSIGECGEIGTGSQIIQNHKIGSNTTVGAGSVVTKDICNDVIAYGVPAKIMKDKKEIVL